jgi:hypothetical protein
MHAWLTSRRGANVGLISRRDERQETYQIVLDLLSDWGWRQGTNDYDVVRDFSIPFVRAANRVRVYGSPGTIAAMDAIQDGLALSNRAQTENALDAASLAIRSGQDHFVIAARTDVGPRDEDGLVAVTFRAGAGPPA